MMMMNLSKARPAAGGSQLKKPMVPSLFPNNLFKVPISQKQKSMSIKSADIESIPSSKRPISADQTSSSAGTEEARS